MNSFETVNTPALPGVDAPLSHAVRLRGLVYCSGQVPLDREGRLVDGDLRSQTRQVLDNLAAVLEAADSSLAGVVRTNVYLTDLADYAAMNAVYEEMLPHEPARTCIQVAALPLGATIEIDCIASC